MSKKNIYAEDQAENTGPLDPARWKQQFFDRYGAGNPGTTPLTRIPNRRFDVRENRAQRQGDRFRKLGMDDLANRKYAKSLYLSQDWEPGMLIRDPMPRFYRRG